MDLYPILSNSRLYTNHVTIKYKRKVSFLQIGQKRYSVEIGPKKCISKNEKSSLIKSKEKSTQKCPWDNGRSRLNLLGSDWLKIILGNCYDDPVMINDLHSDAPEVLIDIQSFSGITRITL